MTLDTLKNDLKQNLADLAALKPEIAGADPSLGVKDVISHLKNTLWPMLEAMVDEMSEMDEVLGDMVTNSEDILQPDTAAIFSAVIAGASTIAAALKVRITREAEPQLYKIVEELESNVKEATEIMKEIVIDDGSDFGEGEGEDDEEDDEDDEDEEGDEDDNEGEEH